jgi:hypothetical protein
MYRTIFRIASGRPMTEGLVVSILMTAVQLAKQIL